MGTLDMRLRQVVWPWALRVLRIRFPWLLAALGAALMTAGMFISVAARDVTSVADADGNLAHYIEWWFFGKVILALGDVVRDAAHFSGAFDLAEVLLEAALTVIILGGVALLPLLWFARSRRWVLAARSLYALWYVLTIVFVLASLPSLHTFLTQRSFMLMEGMPPATVGSTWLRPQILVFPLGVLVNGAALALLLRRPLPTANAVVGAPRTRWQWAGSLLATWGPLVWLIGFYLMPEATTTSCPPVQFSVLHFIDGDCVGIDSDQVIRAFGIYHPLLMRLLGLAMLYPPVVGVGGITLLGSWVRRLSVLALAWLAIWPIWATVLALAALQGARLVVRDGASLVTLAAPLAPPDSAQWRIAPGMAITFVGLGLVVLGQALLWRELLRQRQGRIAALLAGLAGYW